MEWINIKNGLPKQHQNVLMCYSNMLYKFIYIGFYADDEWHFLEGEVVNKNRNGSVTHWMPLPEPPKQ